MISGLNKNGLYFAPRTILKVICWGDKVEYSSGKIAFSYICPVEDLGMPKGYKITKNAKKEALKQFTMKENLKKLKPKKKKPDFYLEE